MNIAIVNIWSQTSLSRGTVVVVIAWYLDLPLSMESAPTTIKVMRFIILHHDAVHHYAI